MSYNRNNSKTTPFPTCDPDYTTIWGPISIGAKVKVKYLPNSDSWRDGRRIVNLNVVVGGLKERCGRCHQLLQLTDCVGKSNITNVIPFANFPTICLHFDDVCLYLKDLK